MINEETIKAIRNCKEFKGKSIADVCASEKFLRNLEKYIAAQREEREAARKSIPAGMRLPAHVIDRVERLGLLTSVTKFAREFCEIINGQSKLASAERNYVWQLGMQAFNITLINEVIKEHPELKDELLNKKQNNN